MARTDPDLVAGEPTMLGQFLDYHRATLVDKVSGLTAEQFTARPIASTAITLGGTVKHLAHVEDTWLHHRLLGRDPVEPWADAPFDEDPDWDWHSAADDSPDELLAWYGAACARSRAAVLEVGGDLDALSVVPNRRTGGPFSLRWILIHLIEETARHNGHVDLIREAIDGSTGE